MEIQIQNVNKSFKQIKNNSVNKLQYVLRNLNLHICNNEIFCLLGNNGAGKSTLMNCIGGIHIPDSGSMILKTDSLIDIIKEPKKAKKKIVFNFQDPKFDSRMSLKANLDFHLRMFSIERETRKKLIDDYLNLFNLTSKKNSKVHFLSGGQKKQLENIRGFITSKAMKTTDILFLTDEPTAYCDVSAKKIIWEEIGSIRERGIVLFSTNDLHEAERLISPKNGKIGFIKQGSIAFSGSLNELQSNISAKGNLNLITETNIEETTLASFKQLVRQQYNARLIKSNIDSKTINIENINPEQMNEVITEAIAYFQAQNIFLDKIEKVKPTINDLFVQNEA